MKKSCMFILLLLFSTSSLHSQTKMFINKFDGSIDSIFLSQIKNISFKTVTLPTPVQGLVAYYPFNGNANDLSGSGYNGFVHEAQLTTDRFGQPNSAYNFDGISSYISLGDILDSVFCKPVAQFSISGWANTRGESTSNVIIGKSAGRSGPYQWWVAHVEEKLCGGVSSDSYIQNFQTQYVSMGTNQWFHFVMIFDGAMPPTNRIRVFVNTNSVMTILSENGELGTSTENTDVDITIGASNFLFQYPYSMYYGDIDDIRIYNRVLSMEEINALYYANN
ncbi:MAG: LamG domain-containing protein [Bacteroidetes bacterium]|nr:LamG domain-containing protein [Bacteroidota bacterium]